MKISKLNWSIKDLLDQRSNINPKPQYQRTEVWNLPRKQKLIDSIMQGYDLPKFYVRRFDAVVDGYLFEVTDGQQRMKAIWDFVDNSYPLGKLIEPFNGHDGLYFKDLPEGVQAQFLDFELSFSEIYQATVREVNELFARLQQGVTLNPAELRNAIPSQFGDNLKKLISHPFFVSSKIVDRRFTYQDYLDNIASLFFYKNTKDLKAKSMSELYLELSENTKENQAKIKTLIKKIKVSLDLLYKINNIIPGYFKNKWAFVDILNYISATNATPFQAKRIANNFKLFELKRKKYTSNPAILLDIKNADYDPQLYKYIVAFNKDGALKANIETRLKVLKSKL